MDRSAEIKARHLTAGDALHTWGFSGDTITAGQGSIIQLEDKVTAALFIGNHGTCDMETAVFIRGD